MNLLDKELINIYGGGYILSVINAFIRYIRIKIKFFLVKNI